MLKYICYGSCCLLLSFHEVCLMKLLSLCSWGLLCYSTFIIVCFRYMSSTLLRIASEHSSVVAVVGKGHLQGIKKYWKQPVVVSKLPFS